jgi:hypothetical protein
MLADIFSPGPQGEKKKMKHLKMVAVSAVAVGALMAMVGASAAIAANSTALCKVATTACPAASVVKATEEVEAKTAAANPPVLTNNIVNVTCKKSSTKLHVSGVTAAPQAGEVDELKFDQCETETGTGCTVTTQGFPANATLEVTTDPNGKLVVTPGTAGNPGAKVVCGVLINCTFTTTSATLTVTGGNPLKAVANKIPLSSTGGFCPKTAEWDAEYLAFAPNAGELYVEG